MEQASTLIPKMTFDQAIAGRYKVMDLSAFVMCQEHNINIRVFDMTKPGAILAALGSNPPGSLISNHP